MAKKIGCLEHNGKYLIVKEDGSAEVLKSEKKFNKYLIKNNCKVAK